MQPDVLCEALDMSGTDFDGRRPSEGSNLCRVLVVDDDDLVRARVSSLLRMSEFDVETAASGEEALRIMNSDHCQIVLTDWQMPDMDGLALCRNLRGGNRQGYVYVVMLTVRDTKEDMLTGLAAGADDYVVKGAPIEEILARLEVARRISYVETMLRASNHENARSSVTDPLTGAHNLRYLMKYLPRELARSRRYSHPMSVLSCDIDDFQRINSRYGPEVGDELLLAFVARSESCLRKDTDWLARVGDDEFMIVLPETPAQGANRVAQKLRRKYSQFPVSTHAGPVSFTATVSVTSVDGTREIESAGRIDHLLRSAERGRYAREPLGGDRATAGPPHGASAADNGSGGDNGAN